MPETVVCLWFDGAAEEAARRYVEVFPRSEVTAVHRHTEAGPGEPGTVLTVEFSLDGRPFLGLNGGPLYRPTEAVSVQVMCADQDEVDHYWEALSDGGEQGPCGWLKDRWGFSWQVVPRRLPELLADESVAVPVMRAMMQMGKLDIRALEAAARG
ncbi:putative 3-demethylubiquinone-9 3-methyltransferase (glyoxalase superfamily) [Motilibacter rhizosphaerae]|uniref:Putative 3-demethylubiquinone-9 3-methyltransferase (Glyoxalase superfamily) n=1 Tax=Motilibacter rhizosphaerae TaxID=598652 RepID=A0A4Q7NPJ4_9ACTN|nr:VOC family protein [Motilibacter rhizosphaerae]RZS87189.1 putative 3-demethylubiquinone-9 3-methyltransferase (glyoxalase superfamily) [Motilibacter rhizosphaerae]